MFQHTKDAPGIGKVNCEIRGGEGILTQELSRTLHFRLSENLSIVTITVCRSIWRSIEKKGRDAVMPCDDGIKGVGVL